jgi:hypothetical protein
MPPCNTRVTPNDELPDACAALRGQSRPVPKWLANFKSGDPFPRRSFFSSRIVFYPGCGSDGYPLQIFGKAHAAHCFVFTDYIYNPIGLWNHLSQDRNPGHPTGYHTIDLRKLSQKELFPNGWNRHLDLPEDAYWAAKKPPPEGPFAFWSVMERMDGFGEDHGPKRISLLNLGWEAITAFDAFFCQGSNINPYAILLQDHGFGCNWTTFGGQESPLWHLIACTKKYSPPWLLVADNTRMWPGYHQVSNTGGRVGQYGHPRALCRRESNDLMVFGFLLDEVLGIKPPSHRYFPVPQAVAGL